MAKKKSDEAAAIERLIVQQEMTNRLLVLSLMTRYPPLFPATTVAAALAETVATPADIARIVPGVTSRSIATIKCKKGKAEHGPHAEPAGDEAPGENAGSEVQGP